MPAPSPAASGWNAFDENIKLDFCNGLYYIPTAIRIFFKRAVTEKGIPFEVREPTAVYNAGSKASSIERRIAALENLQKYRGRIPAGMDYKKELAKARMEKYDK